MPETTLLDTVLFQDYCMIKGSAWGSMTCNMNTLQQVGQPGGDGLTCSLQLLNYGRGVSLMTLHLALERSDLLLSLFRVIDLHVHK